MGGGGGTGLLTGAGPGVLVVGGLLGVCEDDGLNANANGITMNATKTASALSNFFLQLVIRGTPTMWPVSA
jgi:hypothetical protein